MKNKGQKHVEKEWQQLQKAEQRFLLQNEKEKPSGWQEKVARFVPAKLEETLKNTFFKAFELIFEKGTGIIEKTYQREKKEQDYKINEYATEVRQSRRALRAFGRQANASRNFNMAVSTVEGVGMGILGMGIPDIPIFLGVLLKSIYEVALSYGFSYDTEEEQIFILKMIETALSHGGDLAKNNMELNLWIRAQGKQSTGQNAGSVEPITESAHIEVEGVKKESEGEKERENAGVRTFEISRAEQTRRTADALSKEMLYLKFVQGLPIVGVFGGISDMVYQKKISEYAALKYKRRFLDKLLKK